MGVFVVYGGMKRGPDGTPAEILQRLAGEHNHSLAALSRMLRRRDGYLRTFVREGHPETLAKADRELLGNFFAVPASWFGYDLD